MANEPYCRQYDYDEKLLSKMIRTELALESLTREMETMESAFESKIRQVTEMGSDLETKLRHVTEDLVNKVQSIGSRPVRSEGIVYRYVLFMRLTRICHTEVHTVFCLSTKQTSMQYNPLYDIYIYIYIYGTR